MACALAEDDDQEHLIALRVADYAWVKATTEEQRAAVREFDIDHTPVLTNFFIVKLIKMQMKCKSWGRNLYLNPY